MNSNRGQLTQATNAKHVIDTSQREISVILRVAVFTASVSVLVGISFEQESALGKIDTNRTFKKRDMIRQPLIISTHAGVSPV